MTFVRFPVLMLVMVCTGAWADDRPDLSINYGEPAALAGLSVPSAGDGVNVREIIQGVTVRRIKGERAAYLYVAINHPAYRAEPTDLFVTVEVLDDLAGNLTIQYDRQSAVPTLETRYAKAEQVLILGNTGKWRKGYFHLTAASLQHGENHHADFRLCLTGLAVRSIAVSTRKPAGFNPDEPLDAETLQQFRVARAPGMELTFGNDASPTEAALYKALTVTSVESYVDWAGVEPAEGRWDWSKWDQQTARLRRAGLKWVPFLIAGPAYATPLWFQNGPRSHDYRCLEHGQESKVQSLFNPEWRPYVERFIKAFAEQYRDTGIIESLLLGVSGIFGESIYPAGKPGNLTQDGWTARLTGEYHNHFGWWAGDIYAAAAFRAAMKKHYGTIAALNEAWKTSHAGFEAVAPFVPEQAPSERARADFVEWYQKAMTDWAVFWVKTTRKYFPQTEIYLCTGGDGTPRLGADFTEQVAAIATEGAGVRITNEGSDYARNFVITREVASATRFYKTYCGFEPANKVDERGVVARIYNASASGARQLHEYTPNIMAGGAAALKNFKANAAWLTPRQPQVDVALYFSRETWALAPDALNRTHNLAAKLRDITDLDFMTRRPVGDGHLRGHRLLVLAESPVLEPRAAEAIEAWVKDGGVLVAAAAKDEPPGSRLYDLSAWLDRMLVAKPATEWSAEAVKNATRTVGRGRTVYLTKGLKADEQIARIVASLLEKPVDGQLDHRFATVVNDGVLWFDAAEARIRLEKSPEKR
ncbi:MAG: beta-galactosidase [Verrucomicrobiota bacterium]